MAQKFLDLSGLAHLVSQLKIMIPGSTSDLDNDAGFATEDYVDDAIQTALRGGVPEQYQRIEYIQSDGSAWIDTGVTLDGALTFYMEACLPQSGSIGALMTAHVSTASGSGRQGFMVFNTSSHKIDYYWTGVAYTTLTVDSNISFQSRFSVTQTDIGITIEQGAYTSSASYTGNANTNTGTVHLLHSANPNHTKYMNGRIYKAQITGSAGLVRNLVPGYRVSDGAAGLYDKVTGTFFANAGSGSFIVGPAV